MPHGSVVNGPMARSNRGSPVCSAEQLQALQCRSGQTASGCERAAGVGVYHWGSGRPLPHGKRGARAVAERRAIRVRSATHVRLPLRRSLQRQVRGEQSRGAGRYGACGVHKWCAGRHTATEQKEVEHSNRELAVAGRWDGRVGCVCGREDQGRRSILEASQGWPELRPAICQWGLSLSPAWKGLSLSPAGQALQPCRRPTGGLQSRRLSRPGGR